MRIVLDTQGRHELNLYSNGAIYELIVTCEEGGQEFSLEGSIESLSTLLYVAHHMVHHTSEGLNGDPSQLGTHWVGPDEHEAKINARFEAMHEAADHTSEAAVDIPRERPRRRLHRRHPNKSTNTAHAHTSHPSDSQGTDEQ